MPQNQVLLFGHGKKEEEISPLLTEEAVEEHQEYNLTLPPTDSVYILPSPASQS